MSIMWLFKMLIIGYLCSILLSLAIWLIRWHREKWKTSRNEIFWSGITLSMIPFLNLICVSLFVPIGDMGNI